MVELGNAASSGSKQWRQRQRQRQRRRQQGRIGSLAPAAWHPRNKELALHERLHALPLRVTVVLEQRLQLPLHANGRSSCGLLEAQAIQLLM